MYKNDPNQTPLVIKYVVRNRILSWSPRNQGKRVPLEVSILQDLLKDGCMFVPRMHQYFQDEFFFYLILESHDSIDLFEYIERNTSIPEETIRDIIKQVLNAVNHVHSLGIVHRDIKVYRD